jgi:hypothetical protein
MKQKQQVSPEQQMRMLNMISEAQNAKQNLEDMTDEERKEALRQRLRQKMGLQSMARSSKIAKQTKVEELQTKAKEQAEKEQKDAEKRREKNRKKRERRKLKKQQDKALETKISEANEEGEDSDYE